MPFLAIIFWYELQCKLLLEFDNFHSLEPILRLLLEDLFGLLTQLLR